MLPFILIVYNVLSRAYVLFKIKKLNFLNQN